MSSGQISEHIVNSKIKVKLRYIKHENGRTTYFMRIGNREVRCLVDAEFIELTNNFTVRESLYMPYININDFYIANGFCEYVRFSLVDTIQNREDIEKAVKLYCDLVGIDYIEHNLEYESVYIDDNYTTPKVKTYFSFDNGIASYIDGGELYVKFRLTKCIKCNLPDELQGFISLLLLDDSKVGLDILECICETYTISARVALHFNYN